MAINQKEIDALIDKLYPIDKESNGDNCDWKGCDMTTHIGYYKRWFE